jgi:hypothetical protein
MKTTNLISTCSRRSVKYRLINLFSAPYNAAKGSFTESLEGDYAREALSARKGNIRPCIFLTRLSRDESKNAFSLGVERKTFYIIKSCSGAKLELGGGLKL